MLGVFFSLVTAMSWAGSGVINKFLTTRIDILSINTLRLWVGALVLILFVFLTNRGEVLFGTPVNQVLLIAMAGLVSFSAGDTVYIGSLSFIDVSRGFPIAQCTFPVLTMFVAVFLLGEPLSLLNMAGGFLVVVGVYMVVVMGRSRLPLPPGRKKTDAAGVLLALLAAACWTTGASLLKLGVTGVDPFVAAAIRIPVSAAGLTVFVLSRKRSTVPRFHHYGLRNIGLAAGGGVLSYGVASVALVIAMQLIGAGKTVLITAIAPILVLPLSVLILKERPAPQTVMGVVTGVFGLVLVSLP